MCLPDFIEYKQIDENNPIIGYRNWKLHIETNELKSASMNYIWSPNKKFEGPHEITESNSGIYAYNYNNDYKYYNYNYYNNYYNNNNYYNYIYYNNNNNNYNNYNNYNDYNKYNYNYYNHNNYYNYYNYIYNSISGIIYQYGKVAIHKKGQRSEYAKIKTFLTIKLDGARGPKFLSWIDKFNRQIEILAQSFNADTMHWQDFIESNK